MFRRLIAFLVGYLRIEVRGGRLSQFWATALDGGLSFWRVERRQDHLRANLTIAAFRGLRPAARAARSRVRVLERRGLPFMAYRLGRRPVLIAGALTCLGFILWATAHLWVVRVKITGPQQLDPRAVLAAAAEAGLSRGAWKSRVDPEQVRVHIEQRLPEASWVVIRIQGTRAVIEVVEKAVEHRLDQSQCVHLVAKKSGVVEQVIPFQGEPMVQRGDVVHAGDLLIECSLKYWSGGRPQVYPGTAFPPRETTDRTLLAQAVVRARVMYEEFREISLVRQVPVRTGQTERRVVLNWLNRSILLSGSAQSQFTNAEERRQVYPNVQWRNWKSPVELVIDHIDEVKLLKEDIPIQEVVEMARQQMEAQLRWMMGPKDRVLKPLKVEVIDRRQDLVGLRITVETLEDIAAPSRALPPAVPPKAASFNR